jgi:hypothetical protein
MRDFFSGGPEEVRFATPDLHAEYLDILFISKTEGLAVGKPVFQPTSPGCDRVAFHYLIPAGNDGNARTSDDHDSALRDVLLQSFDSGLLIHPELLNNCQILAAIYKLKSEPRGLGVPEDASEGSLEKPFHSEIGWPAHSVSIVQLFR